jgi:tetratricopeptide (TPR) repeat protein
MAVWSEPPSLEKLRKDLALRYVEPEPHMALARYYHDKGDRLQAFLLLEYDRRGLFPKEQFSEAFERTFLKHEPFDNSKEAEAALLKKFEADPKSVEIAVKLADISISREDWSRAKDYLHKAIALKPEEFLNFEALAEVLRREGKREEAEKVITDYLEKHPKSPEAYRRKINPLMKKDPEAARTLLTEALEQHPKDGQFLFNMGVVLQDEKKLKEAEELFVRAAGVAKDSAHIQAWTGRFFLKVREDEGKALEYYLNAYFLDPHFYDTEFAEQRIGKLASAAGQKKYDELVKGGGKLEDVVDDRNPIVVGLAIDAMGKTWDAKYVKPLLKAMGHDDEYVRAKALRALMKNVGGEFDDDLKGLLKDEDLRKRGLAGSLAVKLWGEKGVEAVKPWLKEDSQLLRYDAVSALLLYGGEPGRKAVREYKEQEKHPWFKKWLKAVDPEK